MVNIQITNLMDKPLDYVEGFVIEKNFNKELIDEKRLVLIYGYEPPLQKGFSTTRSISFEKPKTKNPNTYEFLVSKIRFIGESRVFTGTQKLGLSVSINFYLCILDIYLQSICCNLVYQAPKLKYLPNL